jgi:hypothetical protein
MISSFFLINRLGNVSLKNFTMNFGNNLDALFLTDSGINEYKKSVNFFVTSRINSKIFVIIPSYGTKAKTQKYIIKVNKKEQKNSIKSSNLQGIPPDNIFDAESLIPPKPSDLIEGGELKNGDLAGVGAGAGVGVGVGALKTGGLLGGSGAKDEFFFDFDLDSPIPVVFIPPSAEAIPNSASIYILLYFEYANIYL